MSLRWRGPSARDFIDELTRSTTETRRRSKSVMRQKAKKILEASQEGAPIDEGNLEAAHELAITRLSKDNLEVEITVGGVVNDRDVDEYAWIMHETDYNLGPRSEAKARSVSREVGPKFLERAVDDHEDELVEAVADTLPGD